MIARRCAAAGALTIAMVGMPTLAQAAPVALSRAILAAHEFPLGTARYNSSTETVEKRVKPSSDSKCSKISFEQDSATVGMRITQAVVRRGEGFLAAGISDRPTAEDNREFWKVCLTEDGLPWRTLAPPADLARFNPMLIAVSDKIYQGALDIRGVTVLVGAVNREGGPADFDGFWQVLRAQVAKVERQP